MRQVKHWIQLGVNGRMRRIEVEPNITLAECLRGSLGLIGVRVSCNQGECGACTVLLEGQPVNACMVLAIEADGLQVTSIEGLAVGDDLHPLQDAFVEQHGAQCGFCTPGMIMAAKALLDRNPDPTADEVREALVGNICRCGSYPKIVTSVLTAARAMGGR